jgi:hypothetical protein
VWAYALLFHGFAFVLYSLSLFLVGFRFFVSSSTKIEFLLLQPTIIAGLGFATWKAQLYVSPFPVSDTSYPHVHWGRMTVPPNTLAALSIWTTVWLSARSKIKAPFIITSAVVAIIGEHCCLLNRLLRPNAYTTQGYIILLSTKTRMYHILCS